MSNTKVAKNTNEEKLLELQDSKVVFTENSTGQHIMEAVATTLATGNCIDLSKPLSHKDYCKLGNTFIGLVEEDIKVLQGLPPPPKLLGMYFDDESPWDVFEASAEMIGAVIVRTVFGADATTSDAELLKLGNQFIQWLEEYHELCASLQQNQEMLKKINAAE